MEDVCRRFSQGLALILVLFWSLQPSAQNASAPNSSEQSTQPPTAADSSIAGAARSARAKNAAHSKKVITDEDMDAMAGPLPRLKMEGADNTDEIVAAIKKYKATHSPEQTEQAVHGWYDRYDQMAAAAIRENVQINTLRNVNASNGYDLCEESENPQQCRGRVVNMRGLRTDMNETTKNSNLLTRIQQSFGKIQTELVRNNFHYDWFKIRTTNNNDQ
jgi:hypothetical protein